MKLIASRDDIISPRIEHAAELLYEMRQVRAVIWDLDGTLTLPNQIDFAAIKAQIGMDMGKNRRSGGVCTRWVVSRLARSAHDILADATDIIRWVRALDPEAQVDAWNVIEQVQIPLPCTNTQFDVVFDSTAASTGRGKSTVRDLLATGCSSCAPSVEIGCSHSAISACHAKQ